MRACRQEVYGRGRPASKEIWGEPTTPSTTHVLTEISPRRVPFVAHVNDRTNDSHRIRHSSMFMYRYEYSWYVIFVRATFLLDDSFSFEIANCSMM